MKNDNVNHPSHCEKDLPEINDKQLVFICSPFHSYDEMEKLCNIENAKTYCRIASRQGYIPIAPHLFFPQFLNDNNPKEREAGMEMGKQLLRKCSKMWVCGNYISDGMREEIKFAILNNITYEHIICKSILPTNAEITAKFKEFKKWINLKN